MFWRSHRKPSVQGVAAVGLGVDSFSLVHVIREPNQRPRLTHCEYREIGDVSDPTAALTDSVRAAKLEGARCIGVMSPAAYSLRQIEAPSVPAAEVREAARWSIKDLIDFSVEDAIIDIFDIPQPDESSDPKKIYVVAAPEAAVQSSVKLIEEAGLDLGALDITELALRNLVALLPQDRQGVALVYLKDGLGVLTLTKGGLLYLARHFEMDLEQLAESVIGDPDGQKDSDSDEAGFMLDALVLEAQRSLDYYEHQLAHGPISTLTLAPLEIPTERLHSHLASQLSIDVSLLNLEELFDCESPVPTSLQAHCLAAAGAALRADPKLS